MLFLDTSAIINLLEGNEKGKRISQVIRGQQISVSSLNMHEVLVGLKTKEQEIFDLLLDDCVIWSYDERAANHSSQIERELRSKGTLINLMDILIAGVARAHRLHLITCDSDFTKIKGLNLTLIE